MYLQVESSQSIDNLYIEWSKILHFDQKSWAIDNIDTKKTQGQAYEGGDDLLVLWQWSKQLGSDQDILGSNLTFAKILVQFINLDKEFWKKISNANASETNFFY